MISDTFCVFPIDKTSGHQLSLFVFILIQMSGCYTFYIENDQRHGNVRINGLSKIRITVNCCLLRDNNLILCLFVFLQFYWLKQLIHMNFVHGVFNIAIFSKMAQRQRARYRVARYVIVNNVTTATLESMTKNA